MGRDQKIAAEAAALWQALYGEPPPIMTDGATMLDIAVRSLRAEQLRTANITFPR